MAALLPGLMPACKPDRTSAVPTITVTRRRFTRAVDADGHLKPVQATVLTATRSPTGPMRVAWLGVDGTTVKKGDVIARFDDADLRVQISAAHDEKATATAKQNKESLLAAQGRNERKRTTQAATRELEVARTFQRKDSQIYSRDDIITAEIDEQLQIAKADHAQRAQSVDGQVARRKIQMVDVEARKASESISRAETALNLLELRAPHDGVLVFKRSYRGDAIGVGDQAFGAIAEISRSDELEAEVFVLEVEAAGLVKGKPAEIVIESQPHRVLKGEIKRVESVAKRRNFRSPTQYFGVTIALGKTDPASMKPGQRVRAKLLLDERDALVVPRPALIERDGSFVAFRREARGFVPVKVELGAATAGLVSISAGLKEGDVVALRDPGQSVDEILSTGGPASGNTSKAR
jgi:hypothetical protein